MKQSEKKQKPQPVDKSRPQLKGVIPPRLSDEEFDELLAWLKENAKNIREYEIREYEKYIQEISKPPDGIRRN